jgi:hypothetical protein
MWWQHPEVCAILEIIPGCARLKLNGTANLQVFNPAAGHKAKNSKSISPACEVSAAARLSWHATLLNFQWPQPITVITYGDRRKFHKRDSGRNFRERLVKRWLREQVKVDPESADGWPRAKTRRTPAAEHHSHIWGRRPFFHPHTASSFT